MNHPAERGDEERREASLLRLAKMDKSVWSEVLRELTDTAAASLSVSRASVWLFSEDGSEAVCEDLYCPPGGHERGAALRSAEYPRYLGALHEKRTIAAHDATTDPDTREFLENYLRPLGIQAMLDTPVWHRERVAGILCLEQVGAPRVWTTADQDFAASVAEILAVALAVRERVRTEEALRRSETRFRTMFEQSPLSMQILSPDGHTLQVNPAFCRLFGYESDEMLRMTTASVTHPEDRQVLSRTSAATQALLSGEIDSYQVEKRYRRGDGEYFWGLVGVSVVNDAAGQPLYFISQVQDVTERKRAEDALRRSHEELEARVAQRTAELARANAALQRSEEHYRALTENDSDMVAILDREGVIRYQSPASERVYGYAIQEMVGRNAFDFIHPEDVGATAAVLAEVLRAPGTTRVAEFRLRLPGGDYICCEALGRTLLPDSDAAGVVVNTRDITARKQVEEALRESEARSSAIIQHALDCVITIDHEGRVVEFNPAAEATFGYARAEAVGRELKELIIPSELRAAHQAGLDHYLRTREGPVLNQRIEVPALRKDGTQITVELAATAIWIDGPPLFTAYLRDITERQRSQEALRRAKEEAEAANRAKSEFLSRMSHELRTPMNSILGFAQLLARKPLPPDQLRSLDYILKAGRHLLELINEVLDIARIEADRLQLSLEPVGLQSAVQEALSLIQPLAAERDCRIDADRMPGADAYVLADRQRLNQVLLNLLANAVKYNRPGGSVSLSCERAAGNGDGAGEETPERLWLRIRDTGCEIAPEQMERLFVPFERLGAERSGVEGTGLGLTLSKRLVEAMGGELAVESTPGEGSTFSVGLAAAESPLAQLARGGPAADEAPVAGPAVPERRATLLYVEDKLANLSLIETILAERRGITLLSAIQGRLGLDLAVEHRPDLILLDLHLPDMPGQEVLRRLREEPRTRTIPVVCISADATAGSLERLLQAGAQGYLTKPLDIVQFLRTIDDLLEAE